MSVNNQCNDEKTALFKSLSDVGQSYRESLDGCERVLEVQGVGVLVNPPKLHHLLPGVFYLEVLGGLLGHPTSEVELVDLASFIPQRSFIMHHELPGNLNIIRNRFTTRTISIVWILEIKKLKFYIVRSLSIYINIVIPSGSI